MILPILLIMILMILLSFISEVLEPYRRYIVAGTAFVLCLLSATRPAGVDPDFPIYQDYLASLDSPFTQALVEPSFRVIGSLALSLGYGIRMVVIVYALVAIPAKIFMYYKIGGWPVFFMIIALYLGNFYQLHDCTQIRAGAAVAMAMVSLWYRGEGRWKQHVLFLALGILCHYSAAVFLIVLFLRNSEMTLVERCLWSLCIPLALALYVFQINPVSYIPIPFIEKKVAIYEAAMDQGEHTEIHVFNGLFVLRILLFAYVLVFYNTIRPHLKLLSLFAKMQGIGIVTWLALCKMPVLSFRVSELFYQVELFLIAGIVYTIRPSWVGKIAAACFAILFYYLNRVNFLLHF